MIEEYLKSIDCYHKVTVERFYAYRDLLLQWNCKFNLTSITDPAEIELKHFIDSLLGLPFIKGTVIDIGTGAGFPSLPLKIVSPSLSFTLVDSLNKRVSFLNEVISSLNLTAVSAVHSRAEDLPKNKKYDTAVARAVAPLSTLCEYTLPFVKIGGSFVAYKSFDVEEEINSSKKAIAILGGKIEKVHDCALPFSDIIRKIIIIRKEKDTPSLFPRGKNKPKLQPLA